VELNALSTEYTFLCLTETHLDNTIKNGELFDVDKLAVYRSDRNLHGGGVLITAPSDFIHFRVELVPSQYLPVEVIAVCLPKQKLIPRDILIVCVYIPPSAAVLSASSVDLLSKLLEQLSQQFCGFSVLIVGDFNMPDIDWSSGKVKSTGGRKGWHQVFIDCFKEFGFEQLISRPTHEKGNTLDLVFTNFEDEYLEPDIISPGLSDHFMIEFGLSSWKPAHTEPPRLEIKLFGKANSEAISKCMQKNLEHISQMIENKNSIDEIWMCFTNSLALVIDKHVPTYTARPKNEKEPFWFNRQARKLVSRQRKFYNRYKRTGLQYHLDQYKSSRRENKKLFRSIHNEFLFKSLYDPLMAGDSKSFYRFIKNMRGSCNTIRSVISPTSGLRLEDPVAIANELNDYFKSVFNPSETDFKRRDNAPLSSDIVVEKEGVRKLLLDLKAGKAPGPDGIRKSDLCVAVSEISEILTNIFQYSLDIGLLPTIWKDANVAPIFKAGSKSSPSNYRPVSLTCICCKMLEHIVLHGLSEKINQILVPNQHGFRKGLSCTTQLLTTYQTLVHEIDQGGCVQAVVLDFAKAFDRVSHDLLLNKLVSYEFSDNLINWILDFLSERKQRVALQGVFSSYRSVTSGVPQGSVLGPALFLLFINDISDTLTSTIRLYADDALMHSPLTDNNSVIQFQNDLDKLDIWASQWKMSFNTAKCSVVFFGKNRSLCLADLRYTLNGTVLNQVTSFKYLGVQISSDLTWNEHISIMHSKASGTLGLLRRTLYNAPAKIKAVAYKTLCRPKLEFAAEVWDPYYNIHINLLESLQNKAARFILNLRGRCSISEAKDSLGLENLEDRRKALRIKMLHKILVNSDVHTSFNELNDFAQRFFMLDRPETRCKTKGLPLAVPANSNRFLNSFLPRTARELRLAS
jgi:hypothetical protein